MVTSNDLAQCDNSSNPVAKRTMRQLVQAADRIVANRNKPGSGENAPYGTIDDIGRVELFSEVLKKRSWSCYDYVARRIIVH